MFFHSSSHTANPLACAAAKANVAIWRDEPVRERVATLAQRQVERIATLRNHRHVSGTRALNMIAALEIGRGGAGYLSDVGPKLLAFFRDLLVRSPGDAVNVMPPYCIDKNEFDRVHAAIGAAVDVVA